MRPQLALLLTAALALPGCSCRKTDAERAKEERAQLDRRLRESIELLPYRLLKITIRSSKSPTRPAAIDAVIAVLDETIALPAHPVGAKELATQASTYARLLKALYDARETMMTRDEDDFPSLLDTIAPGAMPSPPWDTPLEHLSLAGLWFLLDAADRSHRVPGGVEYVFYELSRAAPQPGWPKGLQWFTPLLRGASFCATGYHFAADEELTGLIASLDTADPATLGTSTEGVAALLALRPLRAVAHLVRAWNRMELRRDEQAADDLEAGLLELKALGVDNELTQWGWASLYAYRERYDESAAEVDRLAASPHLDADTQRELREAAASMREHAQGVPVLLKSRALLIVSQALLARAGGVEALLAALLGAEKGSQIARSLQWLQRSRLALAQSPAATLEQGKALGSRGLEALQRRVEGLLAGPADAGATP
jgi:hypothetical protein